MFADFFAEYLKKMLQKETLCFIQMMFKMRA